MGEMTILNQLGDEKVEWDPQDREQTEKAKTRFDELKAKGYEFYEAVETRGKRITEFSKGLGKFIAAPGVRSAGDQATGRRQAAMAGGPVNLGARSSH